MGVPLTGVYQRLSNPYVDAETHKLRAFLYEGGLLPKAPVTARALLRAAQEGGCPAFLADLRDDRGAEVPFFGHPARSNTFPALLARTTGLPLYAGAAFRREGRALRHPHRAGSGPGDQGPRRRRGRRDRGPAEAVRSLHPGGAGAVDVGAPEMGLIAGKRSAPLKSGSWLSPAPSCAISIPVLNLFNALR